MLLNILLVLLLGADVSESQLPPIDQWPREKSLWDRKHAQRITESNFKSAYPDYADEFDHAIGIFRELGSHIELNRALEAEDAEEFAGLIYVDWGHPIINSGVRDGVLTVLSVQLEKQTVTPGAMLVLQRSLTPLAYAESAAGTPARQAQLADTLRRLGKAEGDTHLVRRAAVLMSDALVWAEEVDVPVITRAVERHARRGYGEDFLLSTIAAAADLPRDLPKRYQRALEALTDALAQSDPSAAARHLRTATKTTERPFDDPRVTQDLLGRTLAVMKLLAERPEADARLTQVIERGLLQLARSPVKFTDLQWRLWSAVCARLPSDRSSDALHRWAKSELARATGSRAKQIALERAARVEAESAEANR